MSQPEEESKGNVPLSVPSAELLSKVDELLANIELLDVRPTSIQAAVEDGVTARTPIGLLRIDHDVSFAVGEGIYGNRYDYRFQLEANHEPVGNIEFVLMVDYSVSDHFTPDAEAADFFASTTGFFAAYPYARELFEAMVTRLHFNPIVLGLIRRDSIQPGSVSIVPEGLAAYVDGEGFKSPVQD